MRRSAQAVATPPRTKVPTFQRFNVPLPLSVCSPSVGDIVGLRRAVPGGCLVDNIVGVVMKDEHDHQPFLVRSFVPEFPRREFWYREGEVSWHECAEKSVRVRRTFLACCCRLTSPVLAQKTDPRFRAAGGRCHRSALSCRASCRSWTQLEMGRSGRQHIRVRSLEKNKNKKAICAWCDVALLLSDLPSTRHTLLLHFLLHS